jgi:hypothetical protein
MTDSVAGTLAALARLEIGRGRVEAAGQGLRLTLDGADQERYSDAQLYNYAGLKRRDFPSRPPLRLEVRACASHSAETLRGTAGFGFWNQPVMPGALSFRLPRQVWFFFGGPPMNMALAKGVPGHGWKAATADFSRLPFLLLAPAAPLGFLLMRIPALYRALWPLGQWAIGAAEALIEVDLRDLHTYRLDWLPGTARFYVDDRLIMETPHAPRGPLGFVAWIDNQYAVLTPQGQLGLGLVSAPEPQWLYIESLRLEPIGAGTVSSRSHA